MIFTYYFKIYTFWLNSNYCHITYIYFKIIKYVCILYTTTVLQNHVFSTHEIISRILRTKDLVFCTWVSVCVLMDECIFCCFLLWQVYVYEYELSVNLNVSVSVSMSVSVSDCVWKWVWAWVCVSVRVWVWVWVWISMSMNGSECM